MSGMKLYILMLMIMTGTLGCLVGGKYKSPEAPTGITYRDTVQTDTSKLMQWFELYEDTALSAMIKATLDSNRDLLTAASRIEEAMYQTAVVRANLFPQLGYSA